MKNIVYLFVGMLATLTACHDAEHFYGDLSQQPEVVANLKPVYAVGDTITISGRLNPERDLAVRVGDVTAGLFDVVDGDNFDRVKLVINEAMGVGEDRSITVTSSGISITVPSIEIVGSATDGVLAYPLQLQKVADIPAGAMPILCRSGNGHVYLWHTAEKRLIKVTPGDGQADAFLESECVDAGGAFTIVEFNAGAISPDERYFYFSAKVEEPGQSRSIHVYKLCRYDLQARALSVLNRTEHSLVRSRRTLAATQPWEGKVQNVKIYNVTAIYPAVDGNVYCNLMGYFLTRLDKNDQYNYLFNFGVQAGDFVPQINDAETNKYFSPGRINQLFPGLRALSPSYIDTEAKVMYTQARAYKNALITSDLNTGFQTGEYANNWIDMSVLQAPYATASLKTFNGDLMDTFYPLPVNGKLIGLYFRRQAASGNEYYDTFYDTYELPTLCEIDFENKRSRRYAPKRLVSNGFDVVTNYQILDRDADGMLYMTANNNSVIVKTAYIQ